MKKFIVFILFVLLGSNYLFAQWKINENFDNGGLSNAWTVYDIDMDGMEWWDDEDNPHSGATAVGLYSMNPSDDWLITPQVNIENGDNFSFWLSCYYGVDEEDFNVKISTTTVDVDDFSDFNPPIHITQTSSDYVQYSYDLSSYAGQDVYLAIQCVSDNHLGGSAGYVTIDDIKVGKEENITPPTFNLEAGTYTEPQTVSILCDTEEAIIYYTLDGSDPSNESTLYSEPIEISETTTIKAIASLEGGLLSDVASAEYIIESYFLTPSFNEVFTEATAFPEGWGSYSGLLTENSVLISDWSKWILQNYANDGSENIGVETTFFNNNGAWFISPSINLSDQNNYQLEFDLALTEFQSNTNGSLEEDDKFKIVISTDNGQTWSNNVENILQEWDNNSVISNNDHVVISLEDFTGFVKIGFYAESTILSNDSEIFVDNISVNEPSVQLNPPTDLVATVSDNDVSLNWVVPEGAENLLGYSIYRNSVLLNPTLCETTNYNDLELLVGTYAYSVTAVYDSGESETSNIQTITIENEELLPPTNLSFTIENGYDVILNWDAPNSGAVIDIEPSDDLYTDINGTQNETQLVIANYPAAGHTERSMLKFDLSSITQLSSSLSTLNLYQFFKAPDNSPTVANIYAITEDWDESSYNSSTHISYDESIQYASFNLGENGWQCIDISTLANKWLDGSIENYGLVIIAQSGDKFRKFYSKDATGSNADKHPFISVSTEGGKIASDENLTGYNVYRNGELISEIVNPSSTTYADENLIPGDYSFYVTAIYGSDESVQSNSVSCTIESPILSVNPAFLEETLYQGETSMQIVSILNSGQNHLDYQISIEEQKSNTSSPGDLISSFETPDENLVYGVGFNNEKLWISDVMYNNNGSLFELSTSGEALGDISIPWSNSWTAEIEATDDYLYSVVVDPSGSNGINKIDKEDGSLLETITGEYSNDGSQVSQALAYNQAADEFWVGGWFHEYIYHVDNQGQTISKIITTGKPYHDITGLAWHPGGNNGSGSLFVLARNPYMIYEINPDDETVIQSFNTYNNLNMNGLSVDDNGSLWTASMTESSVYNIESGVDNIQSPLWLSVSSNSGRVMAGEEFNVEVYFDATVVPEGVYHADLTIISNDPVNPEIVVPTTLTVEKLTQVVTFGDAQVSAVSVYPNPICQEATVNFTLASAQTVNISIFNSLGRQVDQLTAQEYASGSHALQFSCSQLPSGVYFLVMQINGDLVTKKIVVQ